MLDKYQKEVVYSNHSKMLVLAGAGTGKTHTMLERISNLVNNKNVNPESILVLTFTNAAAEDMLTRYLKVSKSEEIPTFNTFHGFCYGLLISDNSVRSAIKFTECPEIATEERVKYIEKLAKSQCGIKLSDKKLRNPDNLTKSEKYDYDVYIKLCKRLYRKYHLITYDELNSLVCSLFINDDKSVQKYKNRYKYIFVDEFQDTDQYQYDFIMSMYYYSSIYLCGDVLQNIYQFRGCTNEHFKELIDLDNWYVLKLENNYRSGNSICEFVNKLSNRLYKNSKYPVELKSDIPGGVFKSFKICEPSWKYTIDNYTLRVLTQELYDLSGSTAILCRTNREVDELYKKLLESGISCDSSNNANLVESRIESLLDENHMVDHLIKNLSDDEYIRYLRQVEISKKSNYNLTEFLNTFIYDSVNSEYRELKILKEILEQEDKDIGKKIKSEFYVQLGLENDDYIPAGIKDLLVYTSMKLKTSNRLFVGTIHSVKGLEFDNVIILNINTDLFPIDNEESYNLLYVACTRAKSVLKLFTK